TVVLAAAAVVVSARCWRHPSKKPGAGGSGCLTRTAPILGAQVNSTKWYEVTFRTALCTGRTCRTLADLTGELSAASRDRAVNCDEVVDMRLQLREPTDPDVARIQQRMELGVSFESTWSTQGAVVAIRYSKEVDTPTARMLEALTRELQVIVPEEPRQKVDWSTVEHLSTADVEAVYHADWQERKLHWRRGRVLEWHDNGEVFPIAQRSLQITNSEHRAVLSSSGHIESIDGSDEYVLQTGGSDSESRLRISLTLRTKNAKVAAALEQQAPSAYPFTLPGPKSIQADDARISGHTLTSIVAELERLRLVKGGDETNPSKLFIAASALFRRDANVAREALGLARGGHSDSKFLIAALGNAGTAETAGMLAQELTQTSDSKFKAELLAALGTARVAEPSVVDAAVKQLADPTVGGFAKLAVGSLAHASADASPVTSKKAADALVSDFRASTTVLSRADALRGLGNSGNSVALAPARTAANSIDPLERAAAAEAVRLVASDSADRLLIGLIDDDSSMVRRAALSAMLYRNPTGDSVRSVQRAARVDPEGSVRREAIRVLVRWRDESIPARQTLDWVARNDPEPSLQTVAAEGLTRFTM
ncbi:MAG TPA: hypothetical protein VKP30_02015, partial [Polyangiaceae bacterium]|nr:hypothetical protein [Polyangiaceae bacterium]